MQNRVGDRIAKETDNLSLFDKLCVPSPPLTSFVSVSVSALSLSLFPRSGSEIQTPIASDVSNLRGNECHSRRQLRVPLSLRNSDVGFMNFLNFLVLPQYPRAAVRSRERERSCLIRR